MTTPNGSSRRVPLRRLSTKRFKTLGQRWADADRRRARRYIESNVNQGAHEPLDWADISDAHDEGMSWPEIISILDERRALAELYETGSGIGDLGLRFWAGRDDRLPPSVYYYHGMFG